MEITVVIDVIGQFYKFLKDKVRTIVKKIYILFNFLLLKEYLGKIAHILSNNLNICAGY